MGLFARLTDTQTQRIIVHGGEAFIANIDCWSEGIEAFCDWSVLNSEKRLQEVKINWGDGNEETLLVYNSEYELFRFVSHEYQYTGEYQIVISALSGSSKSTSASRTLSIEGEDQEAPPPVADLLCNVVQDKTVTCDAGGSFAPESRITGYNLSFGEEAEYYTPQVEHTFESFGIKEIQLHIINEFGQTAQASASFELINLSSDPVASFIAYPDHDNKSIFLDARDSFSNARAVEEFRWVFNEDESTLVTTTSAELEFYFENFGEHTVQLEVVDSLGRRDIATHTIKLFDMPVPDPGNDGLSTMEGIDSDQDGLRDDLQRALVVYEVEVSGVGLALQQVIHRIMALNEVTNNLGPAHLDLEKALTCYSAHEQDPDLYEKRSRGLLAIGFNTKNRLVRYIRSKEMLSGQVLSISLDAEEQKDHCEF